jgi:hypothetical protein
VTGQYKNKIEERVVIKGRCTCRDLDGHARLVKGINLMDAIERLCRIEEEQHGAMIVGRDEGQIKAANASKARWKQKVGAE